MDKFIPAEEFEVRMARLAKAKKESLTSFALLVGAFAIIVVVVTAAGAPLDGIRWLIFTATLSVFAMYTLVINIVNTRRQNHLIQQWHEVRGYVDVVDDRSFRLKGVPGIIEVANEDYPKRMLQKVNGECVTVIRKALPPEAQTGDPNEIRYMSHPMRLPMPQPLD